MQLKILDAQEVAHRQSLREHFRHHSGIRLQLKSPRGAVHFMPWTRNKPCVVVRQGTGGDDAYWDIEHRVKIGAHQGFHLSHSGHYIAKDKVAHPNRPPSQGLTTDVNKAATFVVTAVNDGTGEYALQEKGTTSALAYNTAGTVATILRAETGHRSVFQSFHWQGHSRTLSQKQLDNFKKLHPTNEKIQKLTLAQVLSNTKGKIADWSALKPDGDDDYISPSDINPCTKKIAWVVYDVICLIVGAAGLRSTANSKTIDAIVKEIETSAEFLRKVIAVLKNTISVAKKVYNIARLIKDGGLLGAVFSAFVGSLTWWDFLLYAITGTATIIAVLATDGAAFVAEIVLVLITFAWLVTDIARAIQTCVPTCSVSAQATTVF